MTMLVRKGDPRGHASIYCKRVGLAHLDQFVVTNRPVERCRSEVCLRMKDYDWQEVPLDWYGDD